MGRVFKATSPLPEGAEIFRRNGKQWARWRGRGGRMREEPVIKGQNGRPRVETGTVYKAKYRDESGVVVVVSTRCRTREAAQQVLADLERRTERVRSRVTTLEDERLADHRGAALVDVFDTYQQHTRAKGNCPRRVKEDRRRLEQVAEGCGWRVISDLDATVFEDWLYTRRCGGLAASTSNLFRSVVVTFGNWCVMTRRLRANPFERVPRADEAADRRKERRAMTPDEARRFLLASKLRPLAEYGRPAVRREGSENRSDRRSRRTWEREPLTWENIEAFAELGRQRLKPAPRAKLERRGRERRLVYLVALTTGMRRSELEKLTVNWLQDLEGDSPAVVLRASDEKSRRGAVLPLRTDVAAELREWLAEKAGKVNQGCADGSDVVRFPRRRGGLSGTTSALPGDTQVFDNIPTIRAFDLDLQAAGIEKVDERGRSLDFHALRTTFGTWLSAAGVSPRVAMEAMRHSDLKLTMGVYTDPRLLDVAAAVSTLPGIADDAPSEAGMGGGGESSNTRIAE